jgi:hypothetical protein
MAARIETWTAPSDFRLRQMRLEGESWEAIASALAVSPEAASLRAERIGARRPPQGLAALEDPAREPLPAGHPRAWLVLTEGTWLAGTRYPAPPCLGNPA